MHPDVSKILDLDKLNRQILELTNEIAALPQRVAAIEKKLARTQAQVDAAKAAIKQAESSRRKFESDIQALQQKISKYRDQSLNVKTNQEYKALQDEVTFAENEIRKLEDKILDGMVEIETREQELKNAEAELVLERKQVEQEQTDARLRTAKDKEELAHLTPQRDSIRAEIDEALLRHYDRIFKQRGNATATVRDGKCTACYVMLRPQVYNDVQTDARVVTCDSCGRILYYEPAQEPVPAETANGASQQP